ncbi:hypothetical protein EJ110_NYTH26848 [Nymphaea thermarum]|nr:hypothetical protein EJ110_NYTH26848 [Nymphaea thermarum]
MSSSSKKGKSALSKKSEELREKRTAETESVVKKYMVANEGAFPTVKQVHDEVGGAQYILKGILSDLKRKLLPGNENHDQASSNEQLKNGNVQLPSEEFPTETMSEHVQGPLVVEDKPTEGPDKSLSGNSSSEVTHSSGYLNSISDASVEHNSPHILKDHRSFPESVDHELSWLANILVKKAVPQAEGLFSKNSGFRRPLDPNQEGGKRMALLQQIKDYAGQVKNEKHRYESVRPTGKNETHDVEFHKELQEMVKLEENQENADWHKCEKVYPTEMKELHSTDLQISDNDDDKDGTTDTGTDRKIQQKEGHRKLEGVSVFDSILAAKKNGFAHPFPCEKLDNSQTGESESGDDSDYAAADYLLSGPEEPMQVSQKAMAQKSDTVDTRKHQNTVLVTFLPRTATEQDIMSAFHIFGTILEVQFGPSNKQSKYNFAFVHFKTAESAAAATRQGSHVVTNAPVVINPILPMPMKSKMASIPGENVNDVPVQLEYCGRAVAIQGITPEMRFEHLRHLFSVYGPIDNIILGCSSTIAYIVFKTEEAKERALAARVITVPGSQLDISRVDVPQTTIMRISNINVKTENRTAYNICKSVGTVRRLVWRASGIVDVHFETSESMNMVKILSSLHGRVVDGHKWHVQPATVIRHDMLQILWRTHTGRHHVHMLFMRLCQMISSSSTDAAKLAELAEEYHGTVTHG